MITTSTDVARKLNFSPVVNHNGPESLEPAPPLELQTLPGRVTTHYTLQTVADLIKSYIEQGKDGIPKDKVDEIYLSLCDERLITTSHLAYLKKEDLEALFIAASGVGHLNLVKRLLKESLVDVNCSVMHAVKMGQKAIVEFLVKKGASIEDSYLECAVNGNSQEMCEILIRLGCSNSAIDKCLEDKNLGKFLENKLQERKQFLTACKEGKLQEVIILLDRGVFMDCSALYFAVERANVNLVKELIKRGAFISKETLHYVLEHLSEGCFPILQLLFEKALKVEITDGDWKKSHKDTAYRLIAKMITTLLYKNKRHDWDSPSCVALREAIQILVGLYHWTLADTPFRYSDWLKKQEKKEYFGSYLSSDSDSSEESLYCSSKEQNKIVEWESGAYLDEESTQKTQNILLAKEKEAKDLLGKKPVSAFKIGFSDGKNHFKDNGELLLSGKTKKDKIYPLYGCSNKIEGLSPLMARSRICESTPSSPTSKKYIADYRGYCYITRLWNKSARKEHREKNDLLKPLQSMSVQFNAAKKDSFALLHDFLADATPEERECYEHQIDFYSSFLLKKLQEFQHTGPYRLEMANEGSSINMVNHFTYDSLGELLQSVYSTNYDFYFKLLGSDFFRDKLLSCHSPYVSTAETPYHALKYAYGIKTFPGHQDEALKPRWRNDGKAERPYVGKAYIILHPLEDLNNSHRIISMLFNGKCTVPKEIATEREISYFSRIVKDRIIYQHVAKYPSFKKGKSYKKIFLYKYGMDEELYYHFQGFLKTCRKKGCMQFFNNLLGEYLCAFHEMRFIKIAEKLAKKQGGQLAYLDEFGKVKQNGLAAAYTTPYGNLKEGSPEKAHKTKVVTPEKEKRKKGLIAAITITDSIFDHNRKALAERIIKLKLLNFGQNEEQVLDKIQQIEREYTTLLHYFIVSLEWEAAKAIIPYCPFLNLRDKRGNTPLHLAELVGNHELADLLIMQGADSTIINEPHLLFHQKK